MTIDTQTLEKLQKLVAFFNPLCYNGITNKTHGGLIMTIDTQTLEKTTNSW